MEPIKLPDKLRLELNQQLAELQKIRDELARAAKAGVPGLDPIHARCDDCSNKITNLKREYFPNKR